MFFCKHEKVTVEVDGEEIIAENFKMAALFIYQLCSELFNFDVFLSHLIAMTHVQNAN